MVSHNKSLEGGSWMLGQYLKKVSVLNLNLRTLI